VYAASSASAYGPSTPACRSVSRAVRIARGRCVTSGGSLCAWCGLAGMMPTMPAAAAVEDRRVLDVRDLLGGGDHRAQVGIGRAARDRIQLHDRQPDRHAQLDQRLRLADADVDLALGLVRDHASAGPC
jgi:hypothetical protein